MRNIYNFDNQDQINKVDIHDFKFYGFEYNYDSNQIHMKCVQEYLKNELNIIFNDVLLFDMQSCNFWPGGPDITCMYTFDLTDKYDKWKKYAEQQNYPYYEGSKLYNGTQYVAAGIEINTGDTLEIVCKSIEVIRREI